MCGVDVRELGGQNDNWIDEDGQRNRRRIPDVIGRRYRLNVSACRCRRIHTDLER